jgi:hypothetical protein
MGKAAHTRGPWKAIGLSIHSDRKDGSPETWIANVKQGRADAVEIADARLIAASPDMFEALEQYLPILEALEKTAAWDVYAKGTGIASANAYRAAIARAKGEA